MTGLGWTCGDKLNEEPSYRTYPVFQTLCDDEDSTEGIEHLELDAYAYEYEDNDKKGNLSIVKVTNGDRDQVEQLELPIHPV